MAFVCNATGCRQEFKDKTGLKQHRKSCAKARALIGASAARLKLAPVRAAKIPRNECQETLLSIREARRAELHEVSI